MRDVASDPIPYHQSPKVLIFEEDSSVRAALVEGLKSAQVRVYEASSISSMNMKTRGQKFDLIIVGHINIHSDETSESLHRFGEDFKQWDTASESLILLYAAEGLGVEDEDSLLSSPYVTREGRSRAEWSSLLEQNGLSPQAYQFLPRPRRASVISDVLKLAFECSAQVPDTEPRQRASSKRHERLVLWAGPQDHPIVRELERACSSLYYQLVSVESAQLALRESRRMQFEVSFVHTQLNDMAGLSLVRNLRREIGDSLPVAYVTSAQQVSDRLEGVHAGVSLYLNETAGVDAVTQALRQLQTLGTNRTARILVIDDDEAMIADMITEELAVGNFEVSCLTSPLRALELLAGVQTDLVVIHVDMQGLGGIELCRTLRALPEWQTLPIILVAHQQEDELRIAAYKAGADDYLDLSGAQGTLRACIEGRLERSRVAQDRADRDGLTGLLIRRAFNEALLGQMASAKRRGSTVAVCLIDLDHFKSINDTYGHIAGDRVLSALGRLLSSSFRVEDLRGRWGGEEFVVAFSDESAESAKAILERARREFVRFYFDGEHDERFQATFSAGVSCYPEAGESIEEVFKVADRRLYAVKEAGRNQIFAFDPSPTSESGHSTNELGSEGTSLDSEEPITKVLPVMSREMFERFAQSGNSSGEMDAEATPQGEPPPVPNTVPPKSLASDAQSLESAQSGNSESDTELLPFFTKD